jgi:hypothetical protein
MRSFTRARGGLVLRFPRAGQKSPRTGRIVVVSPLYVYGISRASHSSPHDCGALSKVRYSSEGFFPCATNRRCFVGLGFRKSPGRGPAAAGNGCPTRTKATLQELVAAGPVCRSRAARHSRRQKPIVCSAEQQSRNQCQAAIPGQPGSETSLAAAGKSARATKTPHSRTSDSRQEAANWGCCSTEQQNCI